MVRIIGHRGAPALVPENTIESFEKAIESGVDYIEFDVHLSRDGKLVVIHDGTVDRTTNGKGSVHDFTFDELRGLTISGGLRIPTLEEVLELGFPSLIELKSYHKGDSAIPYDGLVEKVLQLIRDIRPRQEIMFITYLGVYPEQLKGSGFRRILLLPEVFNPDDLDFTDLHAVGVYYDALSPEMVEEAHGRNLGVFSWPPDTEEDVERAINMGLDLMLANDPRNAVGVAGRLGARQ